MQRPNPRVERLAMAAALVTVVLWASAFVGIRDAASAFGPGSIALGRLLIGSAVLGILVAVRGWRTPTRRDLALIIGSGIAWFAFYNLVLNEAERTVDAGTASMLTNVGPIFIVLFAGFFLGERMPSRLLAGIAIAFAGAVVIGVATSAAAGEGASGAEAQWGIVLCLLAALAYAVGVTLQKPALRNVPALQVTWIACLTGAIVCLPFAPTLVTELAAAPIGMTAWLVYLGLFPTSIAFTTWAYALSHTPAGRLGSTTYLVPPIAIVLGWIMLAEVPPVVAIAGGALCIGGVVVARSRGRPRLPVTNGA